jgi:hypothetical protein
MESVAARGSRQGRIQTGFNRSGLLRAGRRLSPLLLVLPVAVLGLMLWASHDMIALDFHRSFRPAAEAVLSGQSPYPPPVAESMAERDAFVYLPFAAFVFTPFVLLPPLAADLVATGLMILFALAALWIVGVRDWRCYGIATFAPTLVNAIQTANLTVPLLLALAAIWALRHRAVLPGLVLALALATKLFLWPVFVWLLATRRYRAAAASAAATVVLVGGSWALIGFAGLGDYPALLRMLAHSLEYDSYTIFALLSDLGAPGLLARGVGIAVGAATLLGCWILGRHGDEAHFVHACGSHRATADADRLAALLRVAARPDRDRAQAAVSGLDGPGPLLAVRARQWQRHDLSNHVGARSRRSDRVARAAHPAERGGSHPRTRVPSDSGGVPRGARAPTQNGCVTEQFEALRLRAGGEGHVSRRARLGCARHSDPATRRCALAGRRAGIRGGIARDERDRWVI